MKGLLVAGCLAAAAATAAAQDQQIGARTKAMGGSYTAFEDDPISVWLNPAGIATQPDQMSVVYQTYTAYPVGQERGLGDDVNFTVEPETILVDPALLPAYLGFVFELEEGQMAAGICFARPYHLNYAMDQITDPSQTVFEPANNVEQSYQRFRVALARDFRFKESGFLTHLSAGVGGDVAYERWEFSSPTGESTDTSTSVGYGVGLLLGVYDNANNLKINLGFAYQSPINFEFDIQPDILPAFDMPQQINLGATFYLLENTPLRVTTDLQFIAWSDTAEEPIFEGQPKFEDVTNISLGFEYRLQLPGEGMERFYFYPRMGIRQFDAPWDDEDDLPATGSFKLVLDAGGEKFTLVTYGLGVSWTTEAGKVRTIDLAGDIGGDSTNFAFGYTHEF